MPAPLVEGELRDTRVQQSKHSMAARVTAKHTPHQRVSDGARVQKHGALQKEFDELNHMLTHQPPSAWAKREKKYHDDKKVWPLSFPTKSKGFCLLCMEPGFKVLRAARCAGTLRRSVQGAHTFVVAVWHAAHP